MNAKKLMNMSQNCEKNQTINLENLKNKTGVFLPYTGVDQAFLIRGPKFVRRCTEIKEKLNVIGIGAGRFINSYVQRSTPWEKNKHKLVYDCSYSHNQPVTEKDARLYVPSSIRKNGGGHINEKISKYYDRLH